MQRLLLIVALAACGGESSNTPTITPASSASKAVGEDENDPKTWVHRLEDPTVRVVALQQLERFFDDAMALENGNREAMRIRTLLDVIVDPMTSCYTKGGLAEKERKDLLKTLADMRDARTAPALVKALTGYAPGPNGNDDVRYASQAVKALADAGKLSDPKLIDAVWQCFTTFAPSQSKSISATTDLHDAVRAVKSPSYGPKAVLLLERPVVLDPNAPINDELDFWQTTAVQVIGDLRYDDDAAIRALVGIMLTQSKLRLMNLAKTAMLRMPKKAVPALASALDGSDPEYAKLAAAWGPDKGYVLPLIDVLSFTSTNAAKAAVLAKMGFADNDTNRAAFAQTLVLFPADAKTIEAFKAGFAKLPSISAANSGTGRERTNLLLVASDFFDPSLVPWLLAEGKAAKGDFAIAANVNALQAATKLVQPDRKKIVDDAMKSLEAQKVGPQEKGAIQNLRSAYDTAMLAVDACQKDVACYLRTLEEPISAQPQTANWKAIKAAWMCAMLGGDQTAAALVERLPKVLNPGARLALVSAIDHLSPKGNRALADRLDTLVADDLASGNAQLQASDDALVKVALRLRARALQ